MNPLAEIRARFRAALAGLADNPDEWLDLIRPAQDARFGDYQANFAMPLAKRLNRPAREVALDAAARAAPLLADLCQPPEVAGPGFLNLRLRDDVLAAALAAAAPDERLGVPPAAAPRTYVIDYSSPNVAKPMHVGHIRSTVIGDALCRLLRFLGHRVISDNHLGDWGTQFGMILYGYKHFADPGAYRQAPVAELARLYRLVNNLVSYHEGRAELPKLAADVARREADAASRRAAPTASDKAEAKKNAKELAKAEGQLRERREELTALQQKLAAVEADPLLGQLAAEHPGIGEAVLAETAKLHAGDPENRRLWAEFLPHCRDEIQRMYGRLGVSFDYEHGESFYQDRLAGVVADLEARGLARESDGAVCVFLAGFETPMIVRKRDGAFLYATTDLATLEFRLREWRPDAILYVVDFRQGEHFEKLFAAARLLGMHDVELTHVSFGTVLGDDGRPFRTRAGDTVGLESLLDEAVARALRVVSEADDAQSGGPEIGPAERRRIAEAVGIAALKYADLSQNRTSDYVFSYDKMLALTGNTAAYLQYSYARVCGIFTRGGVDAAPLRAAPPAVILEQPEERALALALARFEEALTEALWDYRPHLLAGYLYELTKTFFVFYEQHPVLKAAPETLRASRLLLCDLTARTIRQGLDVLGIGVVERM